MDDTRKYPDDQSNDAQSRDRIAPDGNPGRTGVTGDPGVVDLPGDARNDGFDPINPDPSRLDEDEDDDTSDLVPNLPEDDEDLDDGDDLLTPGTSEPFTRSTPV